MALGSGATLHLATAESLLPGPALANVLTRETITHATLPPSALQMLPESNVPHSAYTDSRRRGVLAGFMYPGWQSNRRFVNAYGPTESTVCATIWDCRDGRASFPPIGLPLPNARTYLFDAQFNLTPVGYAGELYLGGVNLARGYLRLPGLTAERFVPDPISGEPGARLYKTGDLVRCRPDGAMVFIGRGDHQVKIRGHRVELGEVEVALSDLKGVKQAVVVASADVAGGNSLSHTSSQIKAPARPEESTPGNCDVACRNGCRST